jgi:hypothetical protein
MVDLERKECSIVVQDTVQTGRPRWLKTVTGLALGLALLGATGAPVALAQDEGVVVGGGASLAGTTASDIEALVNSILAEVLGESAVVDDDSAVVDDDVAADESASTGGDFNVGGSEGGSITMGGGMGGDISIGGASGGTSVYGTE